MEEERQTDFPELEKKKYTFYNGRIDKLARVAGCNYDIGITIINAEDKNDYLFCFPGPNSPQVVKEGIIVPEYSQKFYRITDLLEKENYIKGGEIVEILRSYRIFSFNPNDCEKPTMNDCSFT